MSQGELVCCNGHFTIPKLKRVADSPTRPDFGRGSLSARGATKTKSTITPRPNSTAGTPAVETKSQLTTKTKQQQPKQNPSITRGRSSIVLAKPDLGLLGKTDTTHRATQSTVSNDIKIVKKEESSEKSECTGDTKMSKRDNIAFEVLTTERTYVGLLRITIEEFFEPLKKATPPLIPEIQLTKIFSILEDIYKTNQILLGDLEKRMAAWNTDTQKIGDLFCTFAPYLKMYAMYVSNYDEATAILDSYEKIPSVKAWLYEKYHDPQINVLSLQSLLILPVQRIPRYCLLLKDLVKNTPENHPDYMDLKSSLKTMLEVADQINEDVKRRENRQKLLKLQASLTSFNSNFDVHLLLF